MYSFNRRISSTKICQWVFHKYSMFLLSIFIPHKGNSLLGKETSIITENSLNKRASKIIYIYKQMFHSWLPCISQINLWCNSIGFSMFALGINLGPLWAWSYQLSTFLNLIDKNGSCVCSAFAAWGHMYKWKKLGLEYGLLLKAHSKAIALWLLNPLKPDKEGSGEKEGTCLVKSQHDGGNVILLYLKTAIYIK